MGSLVSFSRLKPHLETRIAQAGAFPGVILDTNVLVTMTYEVRDDHEQVLELLDSLAPLNLRFFATVTTKAEFLDFYRRRIMTEVLRSAVQPGAAIRLTERAKAAIQTVSGRLSQRERRGGDPVFTDSDLKEIKRSFSAGSVSGRAGWLELCDASLSRRLPEAEIELANLGIEYVSQNNPAQKDLFQRQIDWPDAMAISARTCLSLNDAMILNALRCSRLPLLISLDFDMGYAVLSDPDLGSDVAMPDTVVHDFRNFHFEKKVGH